MSGSGEQRKLDEEDVGILSRRVRDMGEAVRLAKLERLNNRRTVKRERRLVAALDGRLYQLSRMGPGHERDVAEISRALEDAIEADRCARDATPVLKLREEKARANLRVAARDLGRLLQVQAADAGSEPATAAKSRRSKKCKDEKGGTA